MLLSKNLRKILYLGLSAVMITSLGAGIPANASAKRVHHARTHRVYHHIKRNAKKHATKRHARKHHTKKGTKKVARKYTHSRREIIHTPTRKHKNLYYTPGHKIDDSQLYFPVKAGYMLLAKYPKRNYKPITIKNAKQGNHLMKRYKNNRMFRYGFDDATTGNMQKHSSGSSTTHVNMLLANNKAYQAGWILSATDGWNPYKFKKNYSMYQVSDKHDPSGMSKSIKLSLHDCRASLIQNVHYGLIHPRATKANHFNV